MCVRTAKLRNGPVDPREALAAAAAAQGDSLAALSRMLDRRSGYLSAFVREGIPQALSERDHGLLSAYFGKPIGIRDLWANGARLASKAKVDGKCGPANHI